MDTNQMIYIISSFNIIFIDQHHTHYAMSYIFRINVIGLPMYSAHVIAFDSYIAKNNICNWRREGTQWIVE